jgi:hypothetical protein
LPDESAVRGLRHIDRIISAPSNSRNEENDRMPR